MKLDEQTTLESLVTFHDLPLIQLSHTFAQSSIWHDSGMSDQIATFDLVVRELPEHRNYLVFGGLHETVEYLRKWRITREQTEYLRRSKLLTDEFARTLPRLRFSGDVWAMPEGTVFFPGEPVIRVTAPIIEASLIEIFLLNATVSNTIFFSKAARVKSAAQGKNVSIGAGLQRAHSFESGFKALRAGHACGLVTDAWPSFVKKFGLKPPQYVINGQHLFVKSYPTEKNAFKAMAERFPDNASFMIDTYDIEAGLNHAIEIGKELKRRGKSLRYVTIDAGDLAKLALKARKKLDRNGLPEVKILIASNLNEYKIEKLINNKIPFDYCVSATEYCTSADSPKLEVVYKMAELRRGNNVRYTAKLTPGKESYPGRKQVFRRIKNGKIVKDYIGLDNEKLGRPLLSCYIRRGKLIKQPPDLPQIRNYTLKQLKTLPASLLELNKERHYQVEISSKLKRLFNKVKRESLRSQKQK